MRIKTLFLCLALMFSLLRTYSQPPCTTLGQTPQTAFPVCGTSTFTQNTVPLCGTIPIPTSCGGGTYQNRNPYWYRFTCFTAGTLGFVLDPMNNADDYDWVIFDITGRNATDVFTDITLNVAENWSAAPGNTGAANNLNGLRNCAGGTPNFNTWSTLIAGHEYLLMVSNWSASQQGYTLTFGGGTAVITDPLAPLVQSASANCEGTQVTIRFNKKIRCNSLAANGSDFVISGATIVSASGFGCIAGFDMDSAIINLSAPLPPGSHLVNIANGTDGNSLLDNCGTAIPLGNSAGFNIAPQNPLAMGTVTQPDCAPTTLTLTFPESFNCNSVAANGSDFTITGPAAVTISSATATGCSGQGTTITLQLAAPILTPGNYQVVIGTGSDGNTLTGTCGRQVPTGNTAPFNLPTQPAIFMGNISIASCNPSTLIMTFTEPINCNSVALNGSDFQITGPAAVVISGATATNCNANGQTTTINLQLSQPMLTGGTYQVTAATGSDGNSIIGNCGREITPGTTSQFNLPSQPPIPMGTVDPLPCIPASITLTFADPIDCNSVAGNGSDFTITGPSAVTITSASAVSCNGNNQTNTITLQLSAPILVTGTYQVGVVAGTDGNTLTNICRRVLPGSTTSFTLPAQPALALGSVTPPPCSPTSITMVFAEPINCNSIAANGSDFLVTGTSPATIVSASATNCTGGQTTTVVIQFAAPLLTSGDYQVTAAVGNDGNTITGACGRQVSAGAVITFVLAPQPPIQVYTAVDPICDRAAITLPLSEPVFCNTIAADGSDFVLAWFPGGTPTVIGAAPVNCTNGMTSAVTVFLSAPLPANQPNESYQFNINYGSDNNTLVGNCNHAVPYNLAVGVTITDPPLTVIQSMEPPGCTPLSLTLTFTKPILCNTIAANGSDFIVTGPSAVSVVAASGVSCTPNGETSTIVINFASEVIVPGNYQVVLASGSDGNVLLGPCYGQVWAGASFPFTVPPQPPLPMGTVEQPPCAPTTLTINFPESIGCHSLAENGSDFVITGPSGVVITGVTPICNANPPVNTITIQLAAPITVSGTYQIQVVTGSDGNTLIGECNRRIPLGSIAPFTIPDSPPVMMDHIEPLACSPTSLRLIMDQPVRCASIAANGSDFLVTGASAVTITRATATCDANGLTTSIDIQLASPIVVGGSYQLQLVQGIDGNTLVSSCYRPTLPSSLSFTASDTVSALFQYQIGYDCETDTLHFSHNGQHGVNQWTWTVNGTQAGTSQTLTRLFSASSQNTVQLVVSNGVCTDTHSESIVLDNKVTAAFTAPDIICPEDTATFIDASTGHVDSWEWSFGNGNTSTLETPPGQWYPLTGAETIYTVSLTVGNNTGCRTTATMPVKVLGTCLIAVPTAFTPNNDGLNDYLYPLNALKAENLDFKVFNRWGQMVFHSREWTKKWDGRVGGVMQATNVFVWTLTYTHRDTKVKYSLKGTSTLIR